LIEDGKKNEEEVPSKKELEEKPGIPSEPDQVAKGSVEGRGDEPQLLSLYKRTREKGKGVQKTHGR